MRVQFAKSIIILLLIFRCGMDYHAPTECQIIKKWLTKCADDSETANYISAHTKDCPKCHICIEKNGGCNHMQCYNCKHDFCWMCLGDWKSHGSEYYECSRYKENPNIAHESVHAQVLLIIIQGKVSNIWKENLEGMILIVFLKQKVSNWNQKRATSPFKLLLSDAEHPVRGGIDMYLLAYHIQRFNIYNKI